MQVIPTNDVFHHLILLLRLTKDQELIKEMFRAQGIEATNSKIKSWSTRSGKPNPTFREMPKKNLNAFIDELYKRNLVINDDE